MCVHVCVCVCVHVCVCVCVCVWRAAPPHGAPVVVEASLKRGFSRALIEP
jgi:hypothetical protein